MTKKALIFGITGQDGFYLSNQLAVKGYEVHGFVRKMPMDYVPYIPHLGDLLCFESIMDVMSYGPWDEVYNLAAQTHVGRSYQNPGYTLLVTGVGAANIFHALDLYRTQYFRLSEDYTRIYQASSSEMFGATGSLSQMEQTPLDPISPYACAKLFAHSMAGMYRKMGLKIWRGILFNHESPRRPAEFVTTKIARAAAFGQKIQLGNLSAIRDWGYAPEYTDGMWKMLQTDEPDDYVLATGEAHSVLDFLEAAFRFQGLDYHDYVNFDMNLKRPIEAGPLCGDSSKAKAKFGWEAKVKFQELVQILVNSFALARD